MPSATLLAFLLLASTPEAKMTDRATGELAGLSGRMDILIEGGKHSYVFEYTLAPEAKK